MELETIALFPPISEEETVEETKAQTTGEPDEETPVDTNKNKYPDCFPPNIEELIIADGAIPYAHTYYRISNSGLINRDAFIGTHEMSLTESNTVHNRDMERAKQDQLDIGDYSTSGYEKYRDAKSFLKCMKKWHDHPKIILGYTDPACGLSMLTKNSKTRKKKNSHIDWWIYKDVHPEVLFNYVGGEEENANS